MNDTELTILSLIDEQAGDLSRFADDIFHHAEGGFTEFRTAEKVADYLKELGLSPRTGIASTGVRAELGVRPGPTIAILGELDGILCPGHPCADKETGYSHACGHNAQLAVLLGAACALSSPQIAEKLAGRVCFFAVPAEESLTRKQREDLKKNGILFPSGKSELIRRGEFDNVDIVITTHAHIPKKPNYDIMMGCSASTGTMEKNIIIHGKTAHAAVAPHKGINAVNALMLGLQAVAFLRETFPDKDGIKVHYKIAETECPVNSVPDRAEVEIMLRAKSMEALIETSGKIDMAFTGCAAAIGATAEIRNSPGYLPQIEMLAPPVMKEAVKTLEDSLTIGIHPAGRYAAGSSDVGDLTHLLPVLHVTFGGTKGILHGADFELCDMDKAVTAPAKVVALLVYYLLKDGASQAKEIMDSFSPKLTKDQYISYINSMIT